MASLVGRNKEQQLLLQAFQSSESEMVAVLGRRRVGKTFLIKQTFKSIDFEFTGILHASKQEQLATFTQKLSDFSSKNYKTKPKNWLEAFELLKQYLKTKRKKSKKIIFIDELPWLDTPKSKFTDALGYFWNDYAIYNNVILILCGSAASWMIKNIVNHKGGLHNRITKRIELKPFTLLETQQFLENQHIHFDEYAITQLYMVMGGIPFYLKELQNGESVAQNIDRICFDKNGLLHAEFTNLFASLYDHFETHLTLIKALSSKWKGITREEIIKQSQLKDGGNITKVLEELERSSFITITYPFGKKKKDALYRISDPYTIFYFHFIEGQKSVKQGMFINLMRSPKWSSWCGYAFENVCFYHLPQIEQKLGIQAIYSEASSYFCKGTAHKKGFQLDLLIDRADKVITICEIKFYDTAFNITKEYAEQLRNKLALFKEETQTKKMLFFAFISTFGTTPNSYKNTLVQNEIKLIDIFI
jgi:AAA+ ATPase superfamily predicted ATPase